MGKKFILMLVVMRGLFASPIDDGLFSINNPSKEEFMQFAVDNNITNEELMGAYRNPLSSPRSAFLYALASDYTYSSPKLERYYQKASDGNVVIGNKTSLYEFMDYLLRQKKGEDILKFLNTSYCMSLGNYTKCGYYLGAAKFLKTGECSPELLNASRKGIKNGLIKRICN